MFSAPRRRLLQAAALLPAAASPWRIAHAQGTVLESTRVINGFAAGGTADAASRRVAEKLHPAFAQTAYVENRTGAGGQIAVQYVKSQPADGATMLLTPMSMLGIYPHTYKRLPYDPVADLAPVGIAATFDYGFAVGPSVPDRIRTVVEFMAWCKSRPDRAAFGSPAAGSSPHFIGILLGRAHGIDMTHAAYRGTQPAIMDMIGGQIPAVCGPVGEFIQYVQAGKCRLLGTSGARRSRFSPGVPTLVEQGYKDLAFSEWYGVFLPARATPELVQRLNTVMRAGLAQRDTIEGMAAVGLEAQGSTPEQLAAALRADTERWRGIVKSIGFSADT
ncbi:Bug family tripartite tricarboxylate transporter substrate binding protein [Xylophilus sp. GOD-11R]|uniref:Bug family tripartite tricarboxylate transporter substrate binding protein n=1 Tax=Xylophilus sp. GOD-11R TaxID=3089814 RepID=UPI00298C2FA0|nr:Bug family tripartite tricarboxylate transporter substrate binding protein [Xylophilus sp. GOD-11R]WPB56828.1 Bug family tripartite tricarboxylate transporter substrate binding protein [Xylophilus sp. GOD-11R]